MKRYFAINLHDTSRFNIPLERIMPDVPANVASNDARIFQAASDICVEGFCPNEDVARPRWIGGSCIKFIDVVFEFEDGDRVELMRPLLDLEAGETGTVRVENKESHTMIGVEFYDGIVEHVRLIEENGHFKTYHIIDYCKPFVS